MDDISSYGRACVKSAAQDVANLLRTRGWIQGDFYVEDRGFCLSTAIGHVVGDLWVKAHLIVLIQREIAKSTKTSMWSGSIIEWNDTVGRTFEDVISLLDSIG